MQAESQALTKVETVPDCCWGSQQNLIPPAAPTPQATHPVKQAVLRPAADLHSDLLTSQSPAAATAASQLASSPAAISTDPALLVINPTSASALAPLSRLILSQLVGVLLPHRVLL